MSYRVIAATAATLLLSGVAAGADVKELVGAGQSYLVAQRESQQRVDEIAEETRDLEGEYQRIQREIEGLEAYNRQIRRQIDEQETEIARVDESISKATKVDRQLLPLLYDMVDTYEELVEVSPPFLPDERAERIAFLKETVDRADVGAAEKFRQVIDAYMTELSYGDSIEAYEDVIEVSGDELEVNVLRLGRIGLFYQTADRAKTGRWDEEASEWVALGSEYRNGIYEATRVANKLTAPSLLSLPLPPPEPASNRARSGSTGRELAERGDSQ